MRLVWVDASCRSLVRCSLFVYYKTSGFISASSWNMPNNVHQHTTHSDSDERLLVVAMAIIDG